MKIEPVPGHDEFEEQLMRFCGPIYIAPSRNSQPSQVIANGTFGLVDTGLTKVLVTCYHVWQAFLEEKAKNSDAVLAVVLGTGFKTQIFDPVFIDGDQDIDLAVFFQWTSDYAGEKSFFPVERFPIPRVETGDIIALQGFPGASWESTELTGRFGACFFGGLVCAANDRKFFVENEAGELRSVLTGKSLPPMDVGGMSGSPAYTFRKGWKLAGFLREGSTDGGPTFFSHASFLQSNGTLDRSQLK